MNHKVRPKKHLGQHFLTDELTARRIADTLKDSGLNRILEIGPGMGFMTKYLIEDGYDLHVIELDPESVDYLSNTYLKLSGRIIEADFLKWDIQSVFGDSPIGIIGNFPYNISSQIVFKVLDHVDRIPFFSGMFQKEVAERIAMKPGSKTYGILSVLCQAHYEVEYLFTVGEGKFNPPPKVKSGVLRMKRREHYMPDCDIRLFRAIVKAAFNQRRKTLRNAFKKLNFTAGVSDQWWASKRAEQLHWTEFVEITKWASKNEF